MTQQFKFGDRVRYKSPESKLRGFVASTRNRGQNKIIVAFEGEDWLHHCSSENLELIPHPDTARLDFIERAIPISGSLKREMNIGWQLQNEDNEPTAPKLLLRDAIDAAMQMQAPETA